MNGQKNVGKIIRERTLALIILSMILLSPQVGSAEPLSPQERRSVENINTVFRRAIEQVRPAVVNIQVRKSEDTENFFRDRGEGSGCIIDSAGYIITNNHVVADMEHVEIILADERRFQAVDVFLDPDTDLAIVKIDPQGESLPVAKFGDSDEALVGDFVMAMGSPFGLEQTVTMGIISYKGRQTHILDKWGFEDFIQTDADINRGNSGGPLVNLYGEVIGINSNIYSPTGTSAGYGFAIPSNLAQQIAQQLISDKKVDRGWLGVSMSGLEETRKNIERNEGENIPEPYLKQLAKVKASIENIPTDLDGVLINEVIADTPAKEAGIEQYDVVISVDDRAVVKGNDLRNYIASKKPNDTVTCEIWREGKIILVNVKLGDRDIAKKKAAEEDEEYYANRPKQRMPFGFKHPKIPNEMIPEEWFKAEKPRLGVGVRELTPKLAQKFGYEQNTRGIIIDYVQEKSLADKSGLKAGDIIVSIDDDAIVSVEQLKAIVSNADLTEMGITLIIRNSQGEKTHVIKQGAD